MEANDFTKPSPYTSQSLTLQAGHEYHIEIFPKGEISADRFKELSLKQRKCHLENEISEDSVFKIYTQQNCKYECIIKMAEELCNCIPWDFIYNKKSQECDIFGRTCFFNAMEKFSWNSSHVCNHCIGECDHVTYNAFIKKDSGWIGSSNAKVTLLPSGMSESGYKCQGSKAFCDFLLLNTSNNETTMFDKGLKNAHDKMFLDPDKMYILDFINTRLDMLNDMIIVHLSIMEPNIDIVDAKYKLFDKLAMLGGHFGIFAEITGCSLLILLNILILLFKLPFSSNNS